MMGKKTIFCSKMCMVPECKSTSVTTPHKLFIAVPKNIETRKKWQEAIRQHSSRSIKTNKYCCGDHFNLKEDIENYVSVKHIKNTIVKMNSDVVPHIFNCCQKRKLEKQNRGSKLDKILTDTDTLCASEGKVEIQQAEASQEMECKIIQIVDENNENASEPDMKTRDRHSSSRELQSGDKFELDIVEAEEVHLISEDFPKNLGSDTAEEEMNCSENQKYKTDEISNKKSSEQVIWDFNDETSQEETNCSTEELVQEECIDVTSDNENTCDKKSNNIGFRFLNNKELEECIDVDILKDEEPQGEKNCADEEYFVQVSPKMEPINVDEVELLSSGEEDDPDDCIVVSEVSSSNTEVAEELTNGVGCFHSDITDGMETEDIDEEIKEDIPDEFEVIEEGDDICIVPGGTQESRNIVIRRINLVYCCPFDCTFLTASKMHTIRHLLSHKGKVKTKAATVFKCPLCPFTTKYSSSFVDHIIYAEEPRFACKKCTYVALKPSSLKSHMSAKHGQFYCETCPYKTRDEEDMTVHLRECQPSGNRRKKWRSKQTPFKCHFNPCPFTATSEESLKTHEWIQHQIGGAENSINIKKYQCDLCCFETFREALFEEHMDKHPGCYMQCNRCPYKTLQFNNFKGHIIRHVTNPGSKKFSKYFDRKILGQGCKTASEKDAE